MSDKRKAEIDAHKVSVEELCKRFNTNVKIGLTKEQAAEGRKQHGRHQAKSSGDTTYVLRDGAKEKIAVSNLTVGDIVEVKADHGHGWVPADIRIIKSDGFKVIINIIYLTIIIITQKVDQSNLTRDSEPKPKKAEFTHENPLETANLAFFNTRATEGSCVGIVFNVGSKTLNGKIPDPPIEVDMSICAHTF